MVRNIRAAALTLAVLLAAQVSGSASTPLSKSDALYADLLPHFQAFFADLSEFEVLVRKPMNRTYSVILVHALAPFNRLPLSSPESFKQESFGLFVIDNTSGRLRMPIDIFGTKRWLDYEVVFERVDERRVDIRRQGATYGDVGDRVSYFLNIGQRKVLGRYPPGHEHLRDSGFSGRAVLRRHRRPSNDDPCEVHSASAGQQFHKTLGLRGRGSDRRAADTNDP